jgi:hypothetical protein
MIYEFFSKISLSSILIDREYIQIITISNILWWLCYFIVEKLWKIEGKSKDIHDTKTRVISIIHASLMFWVSVYDVLYFQSDKCGDNNSYFQNFFMSASLAYFLYDLINCIRLDVSCNEMVIHHLFCMIGYYSGILYNNSANEMLRALVVAEISNPVMHIRMILKNFGLKNSKLYLVLELIYMVIYIFARMVYGTMVCYFTVFCWSNLWLVKIAGSIVWIQSVLFSKRMIKIFYHRYNEYKERKAKKIELFWCSINKQVEETDYYKKEKAKKKAYVP